MAVIKSQRDLVTVGLQVKVRLPTERPASFALSNNSNLTVFGSWSFSTPQPGRHAWTCRPWTMLVRNFSSRNLAFIFDPAASQIYTSSAAGAPAYLEEYDLQVFDEQQAPGVYDLHPGRQRSATSAAGTAWGGANNLTTEQIVMPAPQGTDRLYVLTNGANQAIQEIGLEGAIYVPGSGLTPYAGLYDSQTSIPNGASIALGHDQSDGLGSGAYDSLRITLSYFAAPTAGQVTVTGAGQAPGL